MRTAAEPHEAFLFPIGQPTPYEDPVGDHGGGAAESDLVLVDYVVLPVVPDWLLAATFDCAQPNVACARVDPAFEEGAYLFVLRTSGEIDAGGGCDCAWTVVLAQIGLQLAPREAGVPFPFASDAFVASVGGASPAITRLKYSPAFDRFVATSTRTRSAWARHDVALLVPADELGRRVISWDAQASTTNGASVLRDKLAPDEHLLPFAPPPDILVDGAFPAFE
jgi:hypothetical protein